MTSSIFRATLTSTESVIGQSWVSSTEDLSIDTVRGWEIYNIDLGKFGDISIQHLADDRDSRANVFLNRPQQSDLGRAVMADAVVSYVARLGDCYISHGEDPAPIAAWPLETLDRIAGALEGARNQLNARIEQRTAERNQAVGA